MAEDSRDKFKEARDLFAQSRETFHEGHREGMDALKGAEGEELTSRLDDAIRTEERAIAQMGEAMELQREGIEEQRRKPGESGAESEGTS
jgi:hypothetical protein